MKKIALVFLACTSSLSLSALAVTTQDATAYKAAKTTAAADYKTAKEKCKELSGNPKDVCIAEAKAARVKVEADASAQYANTDKARAKARKDIAEAEYAVAKEKCDDLKGNEKDVCIKDAKAAKVSAAADAKADKKVAAARADAKEDKVDARKDAAVEKCEGLAGDIKDACVNTAKREANTAANPAASADAVVINDKNNTRATDRNNDNAVDAGRTGKPNVVSDAMITTKVKTDLLKEPNLKSLAIHVETVKGVVQLSGFVNSEADAAKAVELARSVKGVAEVKNGIKIK